MSSGKVLISLVAGLGAGAALGVLFAPEKGSTTRKQISQKGEDLVDNLKTRFEEFLFSIITGLEDSKSEAEDLIDNGKEKAQEVKNDLSSSANPY